MLCCLTGKKTGLSVLKAVDALDFFLVVDLAIDDDCACEVEVDVFLWWRMLCWMILLCFHLIIKW